jgi:hypothetical protein
VLPRQAQRMQTTAIERGFQAGGDGEVSKGEVGGGGDSIVMTEDKIPQYWVFVR